MEKTQTYFTLEQVVNQLIEHEVVSIEVAQALKKPHWWTESPLEEDEPTQLFKDLVRIMGFNLHFKENDETGANDYWLTKI